MAVTRNTVNQAVALLVFLVLFYYAWSKDMLFKPDPAIPIKGAKPRKDRAVDMYAFPTLPSFYASADKADELQHLYETDKDAMQLARRMAQVYSKHYAPDKPEHPLFMDVASPWSTWGVYMAAMGMKSSILQPRTSHYRRVDAALSFGKLTKHGRLSRKALSDKRQPIGYDTTKNIWLSVGSRVAKGEDIDVTTTVEYQDEMGRSVAFMVHIGTEAKLLPSLKGATNPNFVRPKALLVDVASRGNAVVDYTQENTGKHLDDLLAVGVQLQNEGFSMKLVPQKECPVNTTAYTNETFLEHNVLKVLDSQQADLLKQLYALATTPNPQPMCRVMWLKQADFEKSTPPFVFLTFVGLKLLCVLFMCYRKKKKAVSRSL
eukprot:TRINITY_DN1630_c0_g1_i1.p2 TRINITY_DN1630_c0_g1~~TRINITY_DN1630_c0_g1_i1.p2  ORF type:complete len:375 (+),score=78.23 TRINITY_DN1630_c0_g1_i1:1971-3095(+)